MNRWTWRVAVSGGGLLLLALPLGPAAQESAEELRGEEDEVMAEESPRISLDFQDANLKTVLKVFSQQTGINVIAGSDVEDRVLTIYLEDVAPMDALDQILQVSHLVYERPAGSDIYLVKPAPDQREEAAVHTETRVYRLRYARVSTSRLAKANEALGSRTPFEAMQLTQLGLTAGGGSGGGGGGAGGFGAGGGGAQEKEGIGIDKVIQEALTEQGKVTVDERTNSVIITDVPSNFARIETILNALDIRTAQILIEAEVLETTLTKLKDLGIEWSTSDEGDLLTFTPAKRATQFPISSLFDDVVLTASSGAPIGTTMGVFDSSKAIASLQALEKDTDTKILARPKVLTLDNESAVIRLTSQQAVALTSVTFTESGDTIQTPERMTTGVILVVTPQLNEDGFITMLVEPSVTKTVASEISPTTIVDPKSRSVRSLVRIRQGETLVLGGLIDRKDAHGLRQVPVLSGIPILGEAFKNREVSDTASELIVFVTPKILSEPAGAWTRLDQVPALMREQAPAGAKQDSIEQALNRLEQP